MSQTKKQNDKKKGEDSQTYVSDTPAPTMSTTSGGSNTGTTLDSNSTRTSDAFYHKLPLFTLISTFIVGAYLLQ